MARAQLAGLHQRQHLLGQGEKTQGVGDGRAAFAQLFGGLLLGVAAFVHQGTDGGGFFDGVQILPLKVFDQGGLHLLLVGQVADDAGNGGKPRQPGSPVTAFAGYDAVAHSVLHHQNGGENARRADAFRQLFQRFLIEILTWLGGVGVDVVNGDLLHHGLEKLVILGQQDVQSPSQSGTLHGFH